MNTEKMMLKTINRRYDLTDHGPIRLKLPGIDQDLSELIWKEVMAHGDDRRGLPIGISVQIVFSFEDR